MNIGAFGVFWGLGIMGSMGIMRGGMYAIVALVAEGGELGLEGVAGLFPFEVVAGG